MLAQRNEEEERKMKRERVRVSS